MVIRLMQKGLLTNPLAIQRFLERDREGLGVVYFDR